MTDELTEVLSGSAEQVAQRLLGSYLIRNSDGKILIGKIVETEAYDQHDAASHSYRGETERTKVMFGPPGFLYVYFTYGMHYCCNVVTGPVGAGAAVLIRALEPIDGKDQMIQNRKGKSGIELTNGPAKTCQAFKIDRALNGHDLRTEPLRLALKPELPLTSITKTTRVGITQAKNVPWRFYITDNPYVSVRGQV